MKYFYCLSDHNGYTYSIDNCIFTYVLKYNLSEYFILFCQSLRDKYNLNNEYWERLNVPACSHWNWYINHIHLCNGIYISSGKCTYLNDKDFRPDCVKLEINLNKHGQKEVYIELNNWLIKNSGSISLDKYDLAIDIPCRLSDIDVFGTNKERGLYKGTRYYGQRNKNGYCKIYDKGKEIKTQGDICSSEHGSPVTTQGDICSSEHGSPVTTQGDICSSEHGSPVTTQGDISFPGPVLTRVEHTISRTKATKKLSLENIYIKTGSRKNEPLNDTDAVIIDMMQTLKTYGEDIGRYTDRLGRRKKQKILECLSGYEYKKLEYEYDIIDKLIEKIREFTKFEDKKQLVFEDKNGFLKITDDDELPFD